MKSISRGVQFSDFTLLLRNFPGNYINPINASSPQYGQTHVKDLGANAARFLTCA